MTDKRAILVEIIAHTTPPRIAEDEFTVNDYRAACPPPLPSRETTQARLNNLVDKGLLESRKVLVDGKWAVAYRKVEGKWDE